MEKRVNTPEGSKSTSTPELDSGESTGGLVGPSEESHSTNADEVRDPLSPGESSGDIAEVSHALEDDLDINVSTSFTDDDGESGTSNLELQGEMEILSPPENSTATSAALLHSDCTPGLMEIVLASSPAGNMFLEGSKSSSSNSQATSKDKSSQTASSEENSSYQSQSASSEGNSSSTKSSSQDSKQLSASTSDIDPDLTSSVNYREERYVTNRFFIHEAKSWKLNKYELVSGKGTGLAYQSSLKATLQEHVPTNVFVEGFLYSPLDLCPVVGDKYKLKGGDEGDEDSVWLCKVGVIDLANKVCSLVCQEIMRQILIKSGLMQCGIDSWLCDQNGRVDVAEYDVAICRFWKLAICPTNTGIYGQVTDCTEITQTGNLMSEIMRMCIRFPNYDDYETKVISEINGLRIAVIKGNESLDQATRMTITSVVVSPPGTNPEQSTKVKCGKIVVDLRKAHRVGPTSTQMASQDFKTTTSPLTKYPPNTSFNLRLDLLRYMENSPHVQQSYRDWGWTKPAWEFQSEDCFVLPFPQIKTSVDLPEYQPSSTNPSWKDLVLEGGVAVQARVNPHWTYSTFWKYDLPSQDIMSAMKRHAREHRYLIGKQIAPVHMSDYWDYLDMIKDCSRKLRGAAWSPNLLFLVTGSENIGVLAAIKKILLYKHNVDCIIVPLPPSYVEVTYADERANAVDMIVDMTNDIGKKLVIDVMVKLGGLPWTLKWEVKNVMMVGLVLGDMSWDIEQPVLGYAASGTGNKFGHKMGLLSIGNDDNNGIGAAFTLAITESAKYFQAKNSNQDVEHIIVYANYSTKLVDLTGQIKAAVEEALADVGMGSPSIYIVLVETEADYRLAKMAEDDEYSNVDSGTVQLESDGFWLFPTFEEDKFSTPTKFTVTSLGQDLTMNQIAALSFQECCHFYHQYSPISMPSVLKYANQTIKMGNMGIGIDLEDFEEKYWVF